MIGTQKDLEPELLMCYSGGKLPPFTRASEMQVDWNLLAKNDTSIINTLRYKMQEDSLVNCYDFFRFFEFKNIFWNASMILNCCRYYGLQHKLSDRGLRGYLRGWTALFIFVALQVTVFLQKHYCPSPCESDFKVNEQCVYIYVCIWVFFLEMLQSCFSCFFQLPKLGTHCLADILFAPI